MQVAANEADPTAAARKPERQGDPPKGFTRT